MIREIYTMLMLMLSLFLVGLLSFGLLSVVFGEQEREIITELSCEELRECIILKTSCLETIIHHSFLGVEWDVNSVKRLYDQKNEYKKKCIFNSTSSSGGTKNE